MRSTKQLDTNRMRHVWDAFSAHVQFLHHCGLFLHLDATW